MSGVPVTYTMEGGFYTLVPSLSLSLKYMDVQITNGSKPVMHKAPTRHDKIVVRLASLNVGIVRSRAGEVVETEPQKSGCMLCARNKVEGRCCKNGHR